MPPLWRNRDFLLLRGGQAISVLGSRISLIAFPLLVLALTGSPAQARLVGFLGTLPQLLFNLPAGVYVDRWDRQRVMIACDAGRAVAMASIPLALLLGQLSLVQIGPLWNVALGSYRRSLVPDELQARVDSVGTLIAWGTIPVGSALSGLLLQVFGPIATVLLLSAVMLAIAVAGTLSSPIRQAVGLRSR